jgi:D-sedoheptulose 7-phosphate isomerase
LDAAGREDRETAAEALTTLSELLNQIAGEAAEWAARMSSVLVRCYSNGGKVLCCGNGGSATQADHAAAELAGRFYRDRRALPALSLSDNVASLTAAANDLGYETVFARQVEGLGAANDVLMVFSTSGKSPNVLEAIKKAREKGLVVLGFTGQKGKDFAAKCDHCLVVPSTDTARIQEVHLAVAHNICALTEAALFERR